MAVLFCCVLVSCLGLSLGGPAVLLDRGAFEKALESRRPHFVKFFAPWCGHCKRLAPTWDELADQSSLSVTIAKVDCTVETALCADQGVRGYPTLKLFHDGAESSYQGARDLPALSAYVLETIGQQEAEEVSIGDKDEYGMVQLTEENFEEYISQQPGFNFVEFYAPWCGHCKRLAPTWDTLALQFKKSSELNIIKIDCSLYADTCKRHGVRGFPTLQLFKGGQMIEEYSGSRSLMDLVKFLEDKMKEKTEEEKGPIELTQATFKATIAVGTTFVKFYIPSCGFCKVLAPKWDKLAFDVHAQEGDVQIASVNCVEEADLCAHMNVHGYPTLVMYKEGHKAVEYSGAQDLESLRHFVRENST